MSSWWWEDYNFDRDYYQDQAIAQQWNEENLAEQEMMRREEEEGDQDAYAPPQRPHYRQRQPTPQSRETSPSTLPDTVLVYRDQHKLEVENYAIVGQTLWAFSPKAQKIPLSELDLQATERANDERGVTFHVPGSTQGQ